MLDEEKCYSLENLMSRGQSKQAASIYCFLKKIVKFAKNKYINKTLDKIIP